MSIRRPSTWGRGLYDAVVDPVEHWVDRRSESVPLLQLLPALSLVTLLLGGALTIVAAYSVLEQAPFQAGVGLTLSNYATVLTTPYYLRVFGESFLVAVGVTALSLLVAYPAAYHIAFMDSEYKQLYLLSLVLPFWINLIVRTFAWQLILGESGLVNYLLVDALGVLGEPLKLLFSTGAIVVGLVHVFLPFAVIPLYTSLRRVDRAHVEAAQNLGANRLQAFVEVVLPQTAPGVAASAVIVFVLSFGSFVIPDMLGGQGNLMIGNIIAQLFGPRFDWALGSAMASVFVAVVAVLVYLFNRSMGLQDLYGGETA
ncbi:MAG: ABC transporter permease [Halolamina sp.]